MLFNRYGNSVVRDKQQSQFIIQVYCQIITYWKDDQEWKAFYKYFEGKSYFMFDRNISFSILVDEHVIYV
jgi:hypothetical protein